MGRNFSLCIAGLGVGALLVGCAGDNMQFVNGSRVYVVPPDVDTAYRAAPVCCASPAEFRYMPLSLGESVTAQIDGSTPAWNFESGKSFFLAYRLPETTAPFAIEFVSHISPPGSYLFHPEVLLLDENHAVVHRVDPRTFNFSGQQLLEPPHVGGKLAFPAVTAPRREKYMLVLTTDSLRGLSASIRDGGPISSIFGMQVGMQRHTFTVYRYGPMTPAGLTIKVTAGG